MGVMVLVRKALVTMLAFAAWSAYAEADNIYWNAGIAGDVADSRYPRWIEVRSLTVDAERPYGGTSSGMVTPEATPFKLNIPWGTWIASFQAALIEGRYLPAVEIVYANRFGTYTKYSLTNSSVVGLESFNNGESVGALVDIVSATCQLAITAFDATTGKKTAET